MSYITICADIRYEINTTRAASVLTYNLCEECICNIINLCDYGEYVHARVLIFDLYCMYLILKRDTHYKFTIVHVSPK